MQKDKNVSKQYPNGRTFKTRDEYLPTGKGGNVTDPKVTRRVVVIDSNRFGELAVVALTTQKTPNTTVLPSYKQGNKQTAYFKHFVEVTDNENLPIMAGEKFVVNPYAYNLKPFEVDYVRGVVLEHCRQCVDNKKKIAALKASDGKKSKKKR